MFITHIIIELRRFCGKTSTHLHMGSLVLGNEDKKVGSLEQNDLQDWICNNFGFSFWLKVSFLTHTPQHKLVNVFLSKDACVLLSFYFICHKNAVIKYVAALCFLLIFSLNVILHNYI